MQVSRHFFFFICLNFFISFGIALAWRVVLALLAGSVVS